MKQLVRLLITILIVVGAMVYVNIQLESSQGYPGGDTITVFNWGDYIDADLVAEFEEETGIRVVYQTFDSNEAMLTKIEQGGATFDIAVPSEYTISKMMEEDLLIPLDHDLLPNLSNIQEEFLDLSFDPENKYSVPYFWGTVGIVYNLEKLGDREITSWNDLWHEDFRNEILLVDGAREVMGMGLNSLYYSLNETDDARLIEAKQKLDELTPNIRGIVGDEIKMLIGNEEAAIGVVWSGMAAELMWDYDHFEYVVPEEGSNLWFDNMVIPTTARNVEGAHQFINFFLDPEIAARNADYVGYSTPNEKALDFLDEEVVNDERFYPDLETTMGLEVYENLGRPMQARYNELFLEFKMHKK
ncbi:ABC transporter substrate-binding protein [Bacillus horti]|uniref:Spermidine/putrescine transport system substrate-binding protein n=1 Tax=Caldalkalibacillus horti TaxID=77523 RepID=A0ABT9VZP4_9BACI|nr:ABC transporter substrate-binding protein [Bacillus horti]MDQ0166456.1 spermidine/putrescine transport system substrate-binding protein [Bacillus horti]